MNADQDSRLIIEGISLAPSGQVSIDKGLGPVLFDLAVEMEALVSDPVDVQHIVAAIIMASKAGELPPNHQIRASDAELMPLLAKHVRELFVRHQGRVSRED